MISFDESFLLFLLIFLGSLIGAAILWLFQQYKLINFKHLAKEIMAKGAVEAEILKKNVEALAKQQLIEQQK